MANREWCTVVSSEIDRSLRKLKANANPDLVLEEFAKRLTNKLLHPILLDIKKIDEVDIRSSKLEYEQYYIQKYGPVADHMNDAE
jgi:glutamyl-tRNA reductase